MITKNEKSMIFDKSRQRNKVRIERAQNGSWPIASTKEFNQNESIKPASIPKRILATLIDYSAISIISFTLTVLLLQPVAHFIVTAHPLVFQDYFANPQIRGPIYLVLILSFLAILVLPIMYNCYFESSKMQATPGKKLMGLNVISNNGSPVGFGKSLAKTIVALISFSLLSLVTASGLYFVAPYFFGTAIRFFPYWLLPIVLAGAFAVPVFNGKQTIVEKLFKCMSVETRSLPDDALQQHRGSFVGTALFAIMLALIGSSLVITIPYNLVLVQKTWAADPIEERGFALEASGQREEGAKLLQQAREIYPDLGLSYSFLSGWAKGFGNDLWRQKFAQRAARLGANVTKEDLADPLPETDSELLIRPNAPGAQ